ncbi:MAG: hypothetical protein Q8L34_05085 [Candidatus Woesearchaeota archaeon]|nr:hypothetical protein [Candidatus Woesearchaeota archaeon]
MKTITVSEEKWNKVLTDVETLIEDVAELLDQDNIMRQRIEEIEADASIGKSEEELDKYLRKRGVKIGA